MKDNIIYDFHIHSCLSGCSNPDMTPANIAGFARLEGLDWIAVTDHNSAANLPAVQRACKEYRVGFLPGIEVTSAEEIHLLCYFKELDAALAMSNLLQENLPNYPYDPDIFGRQQVMDEHDFVRSEITQLLSAGVSLTLYEVKHHCETLGGICVPAHINRPANSLLAVMGVILDDFPCPAYEWSPVGATLFEPTHIEIPSGSELLYSSDAHCLTNIGLYHAVLKNTSPLFAWLPH